MGELIHHPRQYFVHLIHKKCHPKSYHSDIKYHVTLNAIFLVEPRWPLHTLKKNPQKTQTNNKFG